MKRKRGILVEYALRYEIAWKRTVVGWYNVRALDLPGCPRVTLSPEVFAEIMPVIDGRSIAGRTEVDAKTIRALGFDIPREVVAV